MIVLTYLIYFILGLSYLFAVGALTNGINDNANREPYRMEYVIYFFILIPMLTYKLVYLLIRTPIILRK